MQHESYKYLHNSNGLIVTLRRRAQALARLEQEWLIACVGRERPSRSVPCRKRPQRLTLHSFGYEALAVSDNDGPCYLGKQSPF